MKNVHDDLFSLDLGIHEDRDLAQNRQYTCVYVCVTVQATSQLAKIVVTEPPITTVESVVQRTQVIQLGQSVTLSVQCVQRTQVMVEMCADPRLVTADTGVS